MQQVTFEQVAEHFHGKRVAIVGSGPGCLDNDPGFIDSHDVVVRINNYKVGRQQGFRTDVFYSFFGGSIRKAVNELQRDGVKLCICKCPDAKPIESQWHEQRRKLAGVDFRYIYRNRAAWWFCDTFVPSVEHFRVTFDLLDQHVPTTGFSAIHDVLACEPASVYLTGFDFFSSRVHNVDEPWRQGDPSDPIGHRPESELAWLAQNGDKYPISFDNRLKTLTIQSSKE